MIDELAPQAADVGNADSFPGSDSPASGAPADREPEQRRPSARARRTRRVTTRKSPSAQPGAESPSQTGDAPSAPTEPDKPDTEATSQRSARTSSSRSRSRRSRSRKSAASTEEATVEPTPVVPDPEPVADTAAPSDVEPAETKVATTSGRRFGRSRQTPKRNVAEPEQEPAPTDQAAIASADEPETPSSNVREARAKSAESRSRPKATSPKVGPATTTARVAVRRGFPELLINGEEVVPSIFFGNISEPASVARVHSEMRRAAQAGVRLYSTLVELVCPMPPDDTVYQALDERIERVADFDRNAYLMPRIVFHPMPAWQKQYPDEMQTLETGPTGEPSIGSDLFWAEAVRSVRLLIEHIQRTSYGVRVVGYHLERGEWFQPAAGGFDRSFANREGFRRWLRAKYHDSEVALRAAWYDGSVQFFTADIPPRPNPTPGVAFFDPKRDRRWIDFMEYSSDVTADRILALAEAVKSATDRNALVSVSYGYTWEFLHAWSGHLALDRVLASPAVDILTGPLSYSDRPPGCSGALPVPVDSVAAHGKLWLSEDDTKTHLAPVASGEDNFNPRMENAAATESVHGRGIGTALAHQTGVAWMDLWGDGWLDSEAIWRQIASFGERWGAFQKTRKYQDPEVVVLIDERSLCNLADGNGLAKRVIHGNREAFRRCGTSVGFHLQSDVLLKTFPTNAKLYVFVNPYRLTEEERSAIKERIRLPGRTLVWFYTVGSMTDRASLDEPTPDVVGLSLRPQPWNSEVGTRITHPGHPIVQPLDGRTLGSRERLSPSYYVDDDSPGITVLGEYAQTGLPSLVVRTFEGWNSVFCGEPALTPELLRGLCRFAGVHLYTRAPEDYVQAGNGWLSMHILRDGQRTLTIPDGALLLDLADGYTSQAGARDYRTPVRAKTSRLFYIGTATAIRKLGFDPNRHRPSPGETESSGGQQPRSEATVASISETPPTKARTDLAATQPAEIATLPSADEPASVVAELRAELASALASEPAEAGVPPETEPAQEPRKRRRRRGGRGRGRRRPSDSPASNGGSDTAEHQ